MNRAAMIADYRDLATSLGHTPTLLEMHRLGRFGVRTYRQEFGSWNRFLQAVGCHEEVDRANEEWAGIFLTEVEKTSMTRSFKMVPLATWRAHMLKNPVAALTGSGASREAYFAVEGDSLRYVGPRPDAFEPFERAVLERVEWRPGQYFERRYELTSR